MLHCMLIHSSCEDMGYIHILAIANHAMNGKHINLLSRFCLWLLSICPEVEPLDHMGWWWISHQQDRIKEYLESWEAITSTSGIEELSGIDWHVCWWTLWEDDGHMWSRENRRSKDRWMCSPLLQLVQPFPARDQNSRFSRLWTPGLTQGAVSDSLAVEFW